MQKCQKVLREILPSLFKDESETVLSAIADVLTRLTAGEQVRIHEVRALDDGVDALLLMDEWRLVQPVGNSMTKAWEDVSQLIASRDDVGLTLPPWVKTLIQLACNTKILSVRKAILTLFSPLTSALTEGGLPSGWAAGLSLSKSGSLFQSPV